MSPLHAVVWTDHQSAQVLQFDSEHVRAQKIRTHTYHTAQHGSAVRSEHEFFGEICDALDGIAEVLVTGSHTAIADFRRYAEKHRPHTATRIVGYEVVDRPSEKQLAALARKYFLGHDRMTGTPTPT
jgi:DNA-binding ferritin-like protein